MSSPDPDDASSASSDPENDQEFDSMGNPLSGENPGSGTTKKSSSNSNGKDQSRPKRKKARRACFACQRAHLTCGDERPCLRCVKRGIQDQCQDGVRKKAKYLQDLPAEALRPGPPVSNPGSGTQQSPPAPEPLGIGSQAIAMPQTASNYYPTTPSTNYTQFNPVSNQSQLASSMVDGSGLVNDFGQQPSLESPTQYQTGQIQQVQPVPGMEGIVDQSAGLSNQAPGVFDPALFDAHDPMLYNNLNLADANFDNHYGALEFGMLGHLSSTALGTPELDMLNTMGSNQGNMSYDGSAANFGYTNNLQSWQAIPNMSLRNNSLTSSWDHQGHAMDGSSAYSPLSQKNDFGNGHAASSLSPENHFSPDDQGIAQTDLLRQSMSHQVQQQKPKKTPFPSNFGPSGPKRRRDTSRIYNSVTAPFPYTQAFHALIDFVKARYPRNKLQHIAHSLASIRPSLICSIGTLNDDDLIFMEKCFQRSLAELEVFCDFFSTPTIMIRRTGHIVSANKEFTHITGWRREILLGREPNLNVNFGGTTASSGTQTGSSTRGTATPHMRSAESDPGRPRNAFIGDVLDQDSVCRFFEEFAELAFSASGVPSIGGSCSLLKYRTQHDLDWLAAKAEQHRRQDPATGGRKTGDEGGASVGDEYGSSDDSNDVVPCQIAWSIKHDTFDIPMLITMHFLPDMDRR